MKSHFLPSKLLNENGSLVVTETGWKFTFVVRTLCISELVSRVIILQDLNCKGTCSNIWCISKPVYSFLNDIWLWIINWALLEKYWLVTVSLSLRRRWYWRLLSAVLVEIFDWIFYHALTEIQFTKNHKIQLISLQNRNMM